MLISVAKGYSNPLPYRYACFWSSSFLNFGILQDDTYLRVGNVRAVTEKYPPYQSFFAKLSYGESEILDQAFYEGEVKRLCLAFEQQFHYGVFFAYMRLREQEIRNLMWISECVAQNQKSRVHDSVVFIF
ncbi:probable V-type proton ATPase subunit d [Alnus glutinosa]|uniref:probable V-type proton ATPase subunit d n=1 Tax=Alnus glutinosa TaxID=3517 RepID=UPI002D779217|nr:probable V-type proton ATPase subunit d [Alnus glutinosa]